MPNNLAALNPQIWAQESLINLYSNMVMGGLVHRDFEHVAAAKGDTINTRRPGTFVANDMGETTTVQDATAANVAVVLNKWKEVTFALGDKDLTLDIGDLVTTYAAPAMEALAQQIDIDLLGLYTDVTTSVGVAGIDITKTTLIGGRQALNDQKAPFGDRSVVISSKDEAALLALPEFTNAQVIGDDGTALREASLGRKYGMNLYMDQNVVTVPGDVVTTNNLAFHRNAFCLCTRPLALPRPETGVQGAVVNYKGVGLRVIVAYDISKKQHVVSIDCLYGIKTLDARLAARIIT